MDLETSTADKDFCPLRYPGQYEDSETGLYYNRFRYYDPEAGRYVSQDPIRLAGGIALYRYVKDPLTATDDFGLSECRSASNSSDKKIGPTQSSLVNHIDNFEEKIFINRQVSGDEIFYKYHGKDNRTGRTHNYVTDKLYSSEKELRDDLAILSEWNIKIDRVTTFKPQKGTWISEGFAAPQKGATGEFRPGGAYQGLISTKELPKSTVIRTDKLPTQWSDPS